MLFLMKFVFLFCLLFMSNTLAAKEVLTFRKSNDWCPYECNPQLAGGKKGFIADIVEAVFGTDYEVRYVDYAFNRAIFEAKEGNITGVLGVYPTDAPSLLLHKQPVGISTNSFFVGEQESWRYKSADSLLNLRHKGWSIFAGYTYPQFREFISAHPDSVQLSTGTLRSNRVMKMVALGRIQTFYEDRHVVNYLITSENFDGKLVDAGGDEIRNEVFVAFAPTEGHLAALLDEGIVKLRAGGQLNEILSNYNLSDWQ